MSNKQEVCVLFGGKSEEYEVSLSSAYNVLENIDTDRYEVYKIGITREGRWLMYEGDNESILNDCWEKDASEVFIDFSTGCVDKLPRGTVFFPVMHGSYCEDGRLQGIFESLNLRYVGCDSYSSFLCMDKYLTKLVAAELNVPTVNYILAKKHRFNLDKIKNDVLKLSYPVFIKPTRSGSSRGSNIVNNENELIYALEDAFCFSDTALIEKFIKATECEIGVLSTQDGTVFSPVGSLSYEGDFYGYTEKYINKCTKYAIPADISFTARQKITEYAKMLFDCLGCYGISRLDFFVDGENIYFNEINTMPGFTEESMLPMLFKEIGYSVSDIIDILIKNAKF